MEPDFKVTQIGAVMLGVRDLPKAMTFYRDTLGLNVKFQESEIAVFGAGPVDLGLTTFHARRAPQVTGATEVVFRVENVTAAYDALGKRGVKFLNRPRQITSSDWGAHFQDPDGHLLSILGPQQS